MWKIIPYTILQCCLLSAGQVLLKFALMKMDKFSWSWDFFCHSILLNIPFVFCGLCYGSASILWMYILKRFPFSVASPMVSLFNVVGLFSAIIFFHEQVPPTRWIGVALIVGGCWLITK